MQKFLSEMTRMLSRLIIISLIIVVQGCATPTGYTVVNPFQIPETVPVINHPPLPLPPTSCRKDMFKTGWYENQEGEIKPLVGLTPDDSNLFRSCLEEAMVTNHQEWIKVVCAYRKITEAPKHPLCEQHKAVKDEESN